MNAVLEAAIRWLDKPMCDRYRTDFSPEMLEWFPATEGTST
jgi:hypothetical protein